MGYQKIMKYSVVIRTLGKAGEKYQTLLNSLRQQTLLPERILVYIAEGYSIPKETCGKVEYIYVPKGMVAQRALRYDEVQTDYILMLDDDVYLPGDAVERLFREMFENGGDVISPDVFHNSDRTRKREILMTLSGRIYARNRDNEWGYKIMLNGGYSYNKYPRPVMRSQTNAGPCLLCRKSDFLGISFEDESWLDEMPYALGEDQVLFYKMHQAGLKVLTSFDSGIVHLDAGTSIVSEEKERILAYCDCRFKMIFWRKFIWRKTAGISRVWAILFMGYTITVNLLLSLLKLRFDMFKQKYSGYKSGILYKL